MLAASGRSRNRIARTLTAAYAGGLLSDETFARRLDEALSARLIHPRRLVGDLQLRGAEETMRDRLSARARTIMATLDRRLAEGRSGGSGPPTLLALDWSAGEEELLLGRHHACDIVLGELSVSRRHARLIHRDGHWVVQDLVSTNGTFLNGTRVGRSELRPGDRLRVGDAELLVD